MVTTIPGMTFRIDDVVGRVPNGLRWELVEGELRMMTPAGWDHGRVAMTVGAMLHQHVRANGLGRVCGAETGFILSREPDTLRAPDAAFVRSSRLGRGEDSFFDGPPDLAVEVVSPSETEPQVMDKARQWLDAGTQAVWIIWPRDRRITVMTSHDEPRRLGETDTLTGEPVLPDFRCAVGEIFE